MCAIGKCVHVPPTTFIVRSLLSILCARYTDHIGFIKLNLELWRELPTGTRKIWFRYWCCVSGWCMRMSFPMYTNWFTTVAWTRQDVSSSSEWVFGMMRGVVGVVEHLSIPLMCWVVSRFPSHFRTHRTQCMQIECKCRQQQHQWRAEIVAGNNALAANQLCTLTKSTK